MSTFEHVYLLAISRHMRWGHGFFHATYQTIQKARLYQCLLNVLIISKLSFKILVMAHSVFIQTGHDWLAG